MKKEILEAKKKAQPKVVDKVIAIRLQSYNYQTKKWEVVQDWQPPKESKKLKEERK